MYLLILLISTVHNIIYLLPALASRCDNKHIMCVYSA